MFDTLKKCKEKALIHTLHTHTRKQRQKNNNLQNTLDHFLQIAHNHWMVTLSDEISYLLYCFFTKG